MYFLALEARTLVLVSRVIFIQGYAKKASKPTWMKKGSEISQVNESKISVVIFSDNYACSSWCLDELLNILECKKMYGQIAVPVFYNIDPYLIFETSRIIMQLRFARLEERFQDKVQGWKAALKDASNITGCHSRLFS
ncbi:LOW QUALITY PROTEIN: TIR domain containing protein [Parasponia andersonii]|uniref:ADP-ribosyl cyclase/cyclic ADP-ribose hydrolase n=1 Tax=Parasponia andersonii TaxID=3476 RepID=A0A2P5B7G9_PARAD|nr:LOW QUALITY PROTEIN: TIR domain containing protein [Parasponia andersonii]